MVPNWANIWIKKVKNIFCNMPLFIIPHVNHQSVSALIFQLYARSFTHETFWHLLPPQNYKLKPLNMCGSAQHARNLPSMLLLHCPMSLKFIICNFNYDANRYGAAPSCFCQKAPHPNPYSVFQHSLLGIDLL